MPTVLHRLHQWAEANPSSIAQRFKRNGAWQNITAREYRDRVFHLALFLESKGFTDRDVLCILAFNSPQWSHMDLGGLLLRGKSAGIYPNSAPKDVHYILEHTEASVLGVQSQEYFAKVVANGHAVPDRIRMIIVFDDDVSVHPKAVAYSAALAEGRALAAGKKIEDYLGRIDPHAGAFLIYTSGTTGKPKGALLSHDNLTFTADLGARYWKLPFGRGSLFSFLPLCHVAEKLQSVGVGISLRHTVSYCSRFDQLSRELVEVQPALLLTVPRLWEKMMEGVLSQVSKAPRHKRLLAEWALGVGARVAAARFAGRTPELLDLAQLRIADRLVLSKMRHAMGIGQAQTLASGAAALPAHVSRWFRALQVEILEDYGQTESTGVVCLTVPGEESAGTVGRPVTGLEVKIAEDGEILCRGRNVFVGYFKDEESTQKTIINGWLHTGDLGATNEKGQIVIKGRKKEVLKTSNGKMIAPLPIEESLKTHPVISQVCLVGDGKKYISALLTLSEPALHGLRTDPGALSGRVVDHAETYAAVKRAIDELNSKLAGFEQIKKFTILSQEFSVEEGEMTPTLKMKRAVIERRYVDLIDSMYA